MSRREHADMFFADNEIPDLREMQLRAEFHTGVEHDYSVLQEEAVSAQRLAVSRLSDVYVPGCMLVTAVEEGRKTTQEKRFHMSKLINWHTAEPQVLLDELRKGRVRCRLSARMGMGKSTRLPFLMASTLESRVLHVTLSAHALQEASNYIAAAGIGIYRTAWSERKKASVSCMTYADFNGHMISADRSQLFKSFDIIFMDEGFVENVDVMVAKRFLAVYALPDTSIIVASATISTDAIDGTGGSANLGQFMTADRPSSVDEVASNPKLTSDWLVDRTAIFCPTNASVEHIRAVCDAEGIDVMSLDDAASKEEEAAASQWLKGDGATLRVVTLHNRYGIGRNFGISFVLLFPYESKLVFKGDVVSTELVPMTDQMVEQVKSRSGRGIVEGSGGIIFSSERTTEQSLSDSERIHAFVKLCAGNVIPTRNDYWAAAYEVFPEGLSATVATQLLKVCLHPRIAAKYLAADGLFASRYAQALTVFSQPDHYLRPSEFPEPVTRQSWPTQTIIGASGDISVPMLADGEVKVVLQAISAMADGEITVERWRPKDAFIMHDGYDSDDGVMEKKPVMQLRRIVDKPLPTPPERLAIEMPWSYRRDKIATNRSGGEIDKSRMRDAMEQWNQALLEYSASTPTVEVVKEQIKTVNVVESPNGSKICELPDSICQKLNDGQKMTPEEFISLMGIVRSDCLRFAMSKVFDMFAKPWDSILESLLDDIVVNRIARKGLGTDTYRLVDHLRARLSAEVSAIVASSNVFRSAYKTTFRRRPNMDMIMKRIREGRFDGIAQTDGFLQRVRFLKGNVDRVLIHAETAGMYLPNMITSAQRMMPIRGDNYLGYQGDDLRMMPNQWGQALSIRSDHSRSSSKSSLLNR